jgi:hypothetical protein
MYGIPRIILNFDDEGPRMKDIPVVKEFLDVFIDTFYGVSSIAQQPYRMALAELNELKTQLQELLDKRVYTA